MHRLLHNLPIAPAGGGNDSLVDKTNEWQKNMIMNEAEGWEILSHRNRNKRKTNTASWWLLAACPDSFCHEDHLLCVCARIIRILEFPQIKFKFLV